MTLFGMAADADGRPSVFYYANDPSVARLADGFGAGRAGVFRGGGTPRRFACAPSDAGRGELAGSQEKKNRCISEPTLFCLGGMYKGN